MTTSSTFPRSCARRLFLGGTAVVWTGRAEGDMAMAPGPALARSVTRLARSAGVAGARVSWLRQVHGDRVAVVPAEQGAVRGDDGDALVTAGRAALAVMTADCAPIALSSPEGVIGAVHAGWRGLVAGVVEAAVATMRRLGAGPVQAALGPCIHPECYAFGSADLDRVAARFGPGVRSTLPTGGDALDLPAAVAAAVDGAGAELVHDVAECTACAGRTYFSYRGRAEQERQAMVVWKP